MTCAHHEKVVDDYLPWCQFVSLALLSRPIWQVIGQVSDGLEAVQKAKDLQPDLIVCSGYRAANHKWNRGRERMRTAAPDSKILFLSENSSVEIAKEAFRTGAAGYVVKSTAGQELLPALDAILQGDRFVGSGLDRDLISLRDGISGRRRHQIEFYKGDYSFVDGFASNIEAALRSGNVMVVLASESHLASIQQRLRSVGVDVDAVVDRKGYVPLDLTGSLSTVDGHAFSLIAEMVLAAKKEHFHVSVA